jgi:CheY-like chemotaxis protein
MSPKPALLVVDDETNVARSLQMVFEQEGYKVATAFSCTEALRLLQNGNKFDAVITDLNMEAPDVGLEVARAALQMHPKPIVVICTGYASTSNSLAALHMHVDFLANKPVDLGELVPALNRLVARRRAIKGEK